MKLAKTLTNAVQRFICALAVVATFLLATPASAQRAPSKGTLLIATPQLNGSGFSESVILIIQHDQDGTVGLIVNQPTTIRPEEMLPDLVGIEKLESSIFIGGPVASYGVIMLLRDETQPIEALHVFDDVYTSGDRRLLSQSINELPNDTHLRLFAGHAGWVPGQLDNEIKRGSWTLAPARESVVFAKDPLSIWRQLARPASSMVVRKDVWQKSESINRP